MLKAKLKAGLLFLSGFFIIAMGCRKKEAPLPDNLIQFESDNQGLPADITEMTVKLKLTRATDRDIPVVVSVTPEGAEYNKHFTTSPAASSGKILLTVMSGSNEVAFNLTKMANVLFSGEEKVEFKIESSAAPVIIGTPNILTVQFAEIISKGSAMQGDGGGATYGNKVFFDLSANSQLSVPRTKWDLGFFSGDDWRVILNSSSSMMAKKIDANDLNSVSSADTIGFFEQLNFSQEEPTVEQMAYIDNPDGDLSKTAIAEVSATADENKVYIINRGKGIGAFPAPDRGWKKIRIIRNNSGGYTLQHADIDATTFSSIDIPKNASYNFNYVSFENGAVEVEPQKDKWDIAWTFFTSTFNWPGVGVVPYTYQDFIIQNRKVETVKMMEADKSYNSFTESDLSSLTFAGAQNSIGADWRAGGGPGMEPAVRADRYYVIKDGEGNYYKLRFTAMTKNGERGFPAFEYALVKSGQ